MLAKADRMTKTTESVLTLDELSVYLKVSKSSLYKLVQAGKIPGNKVGKHWRFLRSKVDAWLAQEHERSGSRKAIKASKK